MPQISIVSPVFNSEKSIPLLVERLNTTISKITDNYEIILADDGSRDNSWKIIEQLAVVDSKIIGLKLSRNFGQHNAITAGLTYASGDWTVVMDCDLQDKPEEIIKLYNKAQEGYDIVFGRRHLRKDSWHKKLLSKLFNALFGYLTDTKQDCTSSNFGIFSRDTIRATLSMGDYIRVFPILMQWVGFRKAYINIDHDSRKFGRSNYSNWKLFRLAVNMIISFSDKPLRIGLNIGLIISFLSFLFGIITLIKYLIGRIDVPGFTSLMIVISFSTGLIITFLGLLGLYIGKVANHVKDRPNFIISKKLNIQT